MVTEEADFLSSGVLCKTDRGLVEVDTIPAARKTILYLT